MTGPVQSQDEGDDDFRAVEDELELVPRGPLGRKDETVRMLEEQSGDGVVDTVTVTSAIALIRSDDEHEHLLRQGSRLDLPTSSPDA
ncbi:hypothetical protein NB037_06035 [Rathayibacter sp. ZW T2_19]|uniref:Uncharacterized protein n=1 Tax=Rathayibacter rubneri TaxID=2950106 RepID=A0A9X2DXF1_9MICO|nr:hypothetical protein [Rathayibacter rubneri]MCM6761976.1 hypothetical protein [Rathayibacter rubneri]